jgi:predicted nucleic acid-binding protein
LNRLTDDQSQLRIRNEAEAVAGVLGLVRDGQASWMSSSVLEIEISRNPDADRKRDVAALLAFANETVVPGSLTADRAAFLHRLGFSVFDALHLASAEQGQVEVFLTTDDDLRRRARRYGKELRVRVQNPISWYEEMGQ